jgi:hypothetical protein
VLTGELCAGEVLEDTTGVVAAEVLPSSPLKLRLRYRLAVSMLDTWESCEPSALVVRLCPGRVGDRGLVLSVETSCVEFVGVVAAEVCWVAVGVEAPADTLADESVLPGTRLYRPGDAFTGTSPMERERSGIEEERVIPAK